jgi:hypothetical protein
MKEKHLASEQEKKNNRDRSPNRRSHPKMQNAQLGALKGETQNLRPKLIPNRMKQIVQGDGQKTWKDTKLRRGLSCCHNWQMQESGGLNSLKIH